MSKSIYFCRKWRILSDIGKEKDMINVKNSKVKEVLAQIHEGVEKKRRKGGHENETILLESRMFATLCQDYGMSPMKCAEQLQDTYGYQLTLDQAIELFRSCKINTRNERREFFNWANEVADAFAGAVGGNRSAFERFERKRYECPLKNNPNKERLLAIMIYEKYPELNVNQEKEKLHHLGATFARYVLYDMEMAVANVYGFQTPRDKSRKKETEKMPYEQALKKIVQLEDTLERTNMLLEELQNEFDEQLEESRTKELVEFFSMLNSEKYGCILDELLVLQKGMLQLKKKNYELPVEINGLLIMVRKLTQFVKDSHIDPMKKVNSVQEVKASDVEFCSYEGTPFTSMDEKKTVRVISPGWIYRDKEIQISRPKMKEEQN